MSNSDASPFVDDTLRGLRRIQRRALRSIPAWAIERCSPSPVQPSPALDEGDRVLAEMSLRRQAEPMCEPMRAIFDVWLEAETDSAGLHAINPRALDPDAREQLRAVTDALRDSATRILGDLRQLPAEGPVLATLVPLLVWADDLADDGYVDTRVARWRTRAD